MLESDVVMVATVVSRSRIHHGQYGATFQIEKIVHVGIIYVKYEGFFLSVL